MLNRREFLIGSAACASILAAGRAANAAGDVVIGAVYPMSGANAQIGVDAAHAFDVATEIINGSYDLDLPCARSAGLAGLGGAKVRLVLADHQGDPQKGRAEAERLITQEKVCAIVGAFHSSVSSTVSVTCERYGIPYLAADSSSPGLQRRGLKYFFRPAAHDEMFSAAMFDFMDAQRKAGKKVDSVALFFEDTVFGTDSSNVQRKLAAERGYKVATEVKYRSNSPSLTAEVEQLKAADADVLMPSSYTTDALLLVKTMGELGYAPRNMIAQAAGFSEKSVFDAVGDKLERLISRASFALDMAPKRKSIGAVNSMFSAKAGRDLNDNTSRQFTALLVLADAIDRAGSTDGAKIRDALVATDIAGDKTIMPWRGVKFDPEGQNNLCDPVLIQYLGGTFATIFPTDVAAQPAQWPMHG